MQSITAGHHYTQPAAGVSQQLAAKQPVVNTSPPASSTMDIVKHVDTGVTAGIMCRDLHSVALRGGSADFKAALPPAAADPSLGDLIEDVAEADAICAGEVTAAEAGSALGSSEATAAEADLDHDNQEAAAGEADAATMAAWLIQKPSLLQGLLGCLESLAARAVGTSSVLHPPSNPPAGLLSSNLAAGKLSVVSAYNTLLLLQFWLPSSPSVTQSAAEPS